MSGPARSAGDDRKTTVWAAPELRYLPARIEHRDPDDTPITLRLRSAQYRIRVENPAGVAGGVGEARLDGALLPERPARVPILADGAAHRVDIVLG